MNPEIKNLSVSYGSRKVLDDFSHVFEEGKIHCILGPNGCGKTTLLRHLINQYAGTSEISYIPQETSGLMNLPVFDIVAMGRYNRSKFFSGLGAEDLRLVNQAMETMGISEFSDRMYDTLSGGEKQRVMMARGIAQNSPWMILDEPSSNLDIKHSELIMTTLQSLRDSGKSVIIVMHDINLAAKYCDAFLLMKDGRKIYAGDRLNAKMLSDVFGTEFKACELEDNKQFFYV